MRFVLIFLFFLSGCGALKSPKYSEEALVTTFGDKCVLVIEAEWPEMAHGPITLLISGTQKVKGLFTIPRIKGVIKPKDILLEYNYIGASIDKVEVHLGQIEFTSEHVIINLHQDFGEGEGIREISFNGKYLLTGRDNCT
ncbi:hypothetical protein [Pseudoalteromonas sp. 31A1]|uniref:hypothetical protein n=1 Tax=Pseudoalteromonas sp. 31A1 TaxID=2686351 RepID=UPI0013FDB06E|nr:hypothetical protein [Pseudoalteromonas sp. 31A1]